MTPGRYEDDVEDELFLRSVAWSSGGREKMEVGERRKEAEKRMVESTEVSLALLRDCERVGMVTSEELRRQRGRLEAAGRGLEYLHAAGRLNARYLRNMSSLMSSLKSLVFGRWSLRRLEREAARPEERGEQAKEVAGLTGDIGGSMVNSDVIDKVHGLGDLSHNIPADPREKTGEEVGGSLVISDVIDRNLGRIQDRVHGLRDISLNMAAELDLQNSIIDSVADKTETVGYILHRQDKEIRKLLK